MNEKLEQVEGKEPTTSEWILVKESKIHGKGVYARKDIPKGTKVIEYVGRKVTKEEADNISDRDLEAYAEDRDKGAVYLFELNDDYDLDGNVEWNTARLINHSCSPNCETEGDDEHVWIVTIRDIKEGEEITYNYGYDIDEYDEHPCYCGSEKCVGYILDEKHWHKIRKKG